MYHPMKTLICTMGLPRSGKSTWASKQNYPIVNPDSIRLAIHGQRYLPVAKTIRAFAYNMVRSLFLAGHNTVIFDATFLTLRGRDKVRQQMDLHEESTEDIIEVYFKVFDTSIDICIERAKDTYPDLIPVIKRMNNHKEKLESYEYEYTECY